MPAIAIIRCGLSFKFLDLGMEYHTLNVAEQVNSVFIWPKLVPVLF